VDLKERYATLGL